MMNRAIIAAGAMLALAGCAQTPFPKAEDLQPPAARLMTPPKALPAVKEKDDLYASAYQCSAAYVKETGRLKSLQSYVATVLKKE
jgi:hypothetical protein